MAKLKSIIINGTELYIDKLKIHNNYFVETNLDKRINSEMTHVNIDNMCIRYTGKSLHSIVITDDDTKTKNDIYLVDDKGIKISVRDKLSTLFMIYNDGFSSPSNIGRIPVNTQLINNYEQFFTSIEYMFGVFSIIYRYNWTMGDN